MPHVSRFPLPKETWEKTIKLFLEGLSKAKDRQAAENFVNGFLTPTEKIMLAKRFAIFYLLEKGVEGGKIAQVLKVSTATISRLNLWWRNLSAESKKLLRQIMVKREIKNLFVDTLKSLYYGPFPGKGRSWKGWGEITRQWEREQKHPLR